MHIWENNIKMYLRELWCENKDRIHLVNAMTQQCFLMSTVMIPSVCIIDGVYLL
jgi:hypothetical protein